MHNRTNQPQLSLPSLRHLYCLSEWNGGNSNIVTSQQPAYGHLVDVELQMVRCAIGRYGSNGLDTESARCLINYDDETEKRTVHVREQQYYFGHSFSHRIDNNWNSISSNTTSATISTSYSRRRTVGSGRKKRRRRRSFVLDNVNSNCTVKQWRRHTRCVGCVRTPREENTSYFCTWFLSDLYVKRARSYVIVKQYEVTKSVIGLRSTCFTFFKL